MFGGQFPFRVHWASLRAAIAGIGSERYYGMFPSVKAMHTAPCEALCWFAHVWSEPLQKGAKPHYSLKISTLSVKATTGQCETRTRADSADIQRQVSRISSDSFYHSTTGTLEITTRIYDICRLALRETTVNFKFSREWQTPATLKLPILSLRKFVWVCH